jgi:hypothetical protein
VHRLFDLGHLAVDPRDHTIDVSEAIGDYPDYYQLQGEKLRAELTARQERWIAKHWAMHRSRADSGVGRTESAAS